MTFLRLVGAQSPRAWTVHTATRFGRCANTPYRRRWTRLGQIAAALLSPRPGWPARRQHARDDWSNWRRGLSNTLSHSHSRPGARLWWKPRTGRLDWRGHDLSSCCGRDISDGMARHMIERHTRRGGFAYFHTAGKSHGKQGKMRLPGKLGIHTGVLGNMSISLTGVLI